MLISLLLLDVAPDPVSGPITIAGLILIVVVVLMFAAATITGFVFLLRWLMRKSRRGRGPTVREDAVSQFQPTSPNQP